MLHTLIWTIISTFQDVTCLNEWQPEMSVLLKKTIYSPENEYHTQRCAAGLLYAGQKPEQYRRGLCGEQVRCSLC
jgi:hypothetical protein